MQFVGHQLRERGARVLAELNFAGKYRDGIVFADVQPGVDLLRNCRSRRAPSRLLLRQRFSAGRHEDGDAASHEFEKIAALEAEAVAGRFGKLVALGLKLVVDGRVEFGDVFCVAHVTPPC